MKVKGKGVCVKPLLVEGGGLNKRKGSNLIGRGGSFSAVAIPLEKHSQE